MKTKVSPAIVGLFVLGAFMLALIALLAFGGMSLFSKPQRFIVYFDESIHGLDLGSPVKLRGVRIGRVVDFGLRYIPSENRSVVAVVCEATRNVVSDERGRPVDLSNPKKVQGLIDHGLRAQLGVIGLATGLLYVELDFMNPKVYPVVTDPELKSDYIDIPSVPSTSTQIQNNVVQILDNMRQVDFAGLSSRLDALLSDARVKLDAADVTGLVAQWKQAGASVQAIATSDQLKQTLSNLGAASKSLNDILGKLDRDGTAAQLGDTLAQARQAIATFTSTASTLQNFVRSQRDLGYNASQAFARLAEAAASVRALADYLDRNPQALLSGRKQPASQSNP